MAVKRQHEDTYPMYFCSFTCYRWLSLFEITNSYECVYKWFNYLKAKRIDVVCYVIMPNHLHLIIHFQTVPFDLNKVIGNAKRFLAYEIIHRLKKSENVDVLNELSSGVAERDSRKGQRHRAFEPSFDAKAVFSEYFLRQKVDYIHFNPVRGKWQLAKDFTLYEHSSAAFYELGNAVHFAPVHYHDVEMYAG